VITSIKGGLCSHKKGETQYKRGEERPQPYYTLQGGITPQPSSTSFPPSIHYIEDWFVESRGEPRGGFKTEKDMKMPYLGFIRFLIYLVFSDHPGKIYPTPMCVSYNTMG